MSQYRAPLQEMLFTMNELAGLPALAQLPGFEEATPETVGRDPRGSGQVRDRRARSAQRGRRSRRRAPARRRHGGHAAGFKDAYRQFCELGWNGLAKNPEYGGQGMPHLVAAAIDEMWNAANMAFELCPMLTGGAIEAIEMNGSDALKKAYLPKMVSGEWTGTMNLTEPQAGSDLAAVRTKAVPQPDGTYKLSGNKIFITYGEHDYTDNIVHLVLARTPDAPPGVKGISLFVVPKFIVGADGTPGARNDVRCVSLEHKLGIHASPTAVLAFGDAGGAVGYVVGEENRGLEYMFVMMNQARFGVGMQGVGLPIVPTSAPSPTRASACRGVTGDAAPGIIGHPDVRRMLLTMRASTEAARALGYVTAAALDFAHRHPDEAVRERKRAFAELMIPIVKGWSTEGAQRNASLGVQVHGGMGYIEETGAAQYLRDARITTIYEGTTGIQANDLVGRKIGRDRGAALMAAIADLRETVTALDGDRGRESRRHRHPPRRRPRCRRGRGAACRRIDAHGYARRARGRGSVPRARGHRVRRRAARPRRARGRKRLAAGHGDADFLRAKIATARHFADHFLTQAPGLREGRDRRRQRSARARRRAVLNERTE